MVASTDWSFARRPFWLFSHLFALSVVVLFIALGLWQLARHGERAEFNQVVGERSTPPALSLDEALDRPADEVAYRLVTVTGTYLDGDLVRVGNRTQGGVAGEHVVALFELADGRRLLVNRGFVPLGAGDVDRASGSVADIELRAVPTGAVTIQGWLQESVVRGWLGATDNGQSRVIPRFDVAAIEGRLDPGGSVVPFWLLADGDTDAAATAGAATIAPDFPDPVPLPPLDGGPHLSYMGQWFIFATLGVGFYVALLRRASRGRTRSQRVEDGLPIG